MRNCEIVDSCRENSSLGFWRVVVGRAYWVEDLSKEKGGDCEIEYEDEEGSGDDEDVELKPF